MPDTVSCSLIAVSIAGRFCTQVVKVNSADDFINPPELGIADVMARKMAHCRFILIPTRVCGPKADV